MQAKRGREARSMRGDDTHSVMSEPGNNLSTSAGTTSQGNGHKPAREDARLAMASSSPTQPQQPQRPQQMQLASASLSLHLVWMTISPDGTLDMPTWRAYTGQSKEDVQGEGWLDAIHPDDRPRIAQVWRHAQTTHSLYETEYRLRRADGIYQRFAVRGVPVLTTNGAIAEWVIHYLPLDEGNNTEPDVSAKAESRKETSAVPESDGQHRDDQPEPASVANETSRLLLAQTTLSMGSLVAVVAAIADGALLYDGEGRLICVNDTARRIFGFDSLPADYPTLTLDARSAYLTIEDEQGDPLPSEHWPLTRVLAGEVLTSVTPMELAVRTATGATIELNVSGSPLRGATGEITGALLICRDVTEQRRLERRTHGALNTLLAMAEALVLVSGELDLDTEHPDTPATASAQTARQVGRQLADLTCGVLDCKRVGIIAVEPETLRTTPIAVAGLTQDNERQWWDDWRSARMLSERFAEPLIERLRNDQVVIIDLTQPSNHEMPNLFYGECPALIVPMRIGDELIGLLIVVHDGERHDYTLEEITLAGAVAKVTALVIERQRLLLERAEAQANALTLQQTNRRMDEFLSIASHELRTPLTTIKANVQLSVRRVRTLMEHGDMLETMANRLATLQELLSRAERQTQLLDRLVGDLLDVSRIQANKLALRLEPCELGEIVREATLEQRLAWPSRPISLELPEQSVAIVADADRIGQVVTNYLTNALKYSAEDTPVAVRLRLEGQPEQNGRRVARVEVQDEGPGLPPEEQTRIWERFQRIEGIHVQSGSGVGLGLGLYISKTIVERHGGQVGIESEQGKGSTFWFSVPLA